MAFGSTINPAGLAHLVRRASSDSSGRRDAADMRAAEKKVVARQAATKRAVASKKNAPNSAMAATRAAIAKYGKR